MISAIIGPHLPPNPHKINFVEVRRDEIIFYYESSLIKIYFSSKRIPVELMEYACRMQLLENSFRKEIPTSYLSVEFSGRPKEYLENSIFYSQFRGVMELLEYKNQIVRVGIRTP